MHAALVCPVGQDVSGPFIPIEASGAEPYAHRGGGGLHLASIRLGCPRLPNASVKDAEMHMVWLCASRSA